MIKINDVKHYTTEEEESEKNRRFIRKIRYEKQERTFKLNRTVHDSFIWYNIKTLLKELKKLNRLIDLNLKGFRKVSTYSTLNKKCTTIVS